MSWPHLFCAPPTGDGCGSYCGNANERLSMPVVLVMLLVVLVRIPPRSLIMFNVHRHMTPSFLKYPSQRVVLLPHAIHLAFEILHLFNGRHAAICLLGELALDIAASALGTASRLCGVAFDFALSAGVAARILSSLSVCPFMASHAADAIARQHV